MCVCVRLELVVAKLAVDVQSSLADCCGCARGRMCVAASVQDSECSLSRAAQHFCNIGGLERPHRRSRHY